MVVLSVCLFLGADVPKDTIKKEMEKIQGEWSMVSGERDGQPFSEEIVNDAKRVVKGDEVTVTVGGQVFLKAKITVDPSKKPKNIDYKILDGPEKDMTMLGIYEFNGEMLKFCSAAAGKDRPGDFKTSENSGRTSTIWKRDKK
jgi:uncharacterized protein (TIGR03067 family)